MWWRVLNSSGARYGPLADSCGKVMKVGLLKGLVISSIVKVCRIQWARGVSRGFAPARLLGLCVRILPEAWMFVNFGCCVLRSRDFRDEIVTRPEQYYRVWCVCV